MTGKDKRVVLVHRYFWPDTPPYAFMLGAIATRLAESGYVVHVVSSQPSYKSSQTVGRRASREVVNGFSIHRLSMLAYSKSIWFRVVDSVYFLLAVAAKLIRLRPQIIMISTMPPVFSGAMVRMVSKAIGAKYIYHCQDIHPEVAQAGGDINDGLLVECFKRIDSKSCNSSFATVVLSQDMKNTLVQRGVEPNKIRVINNFELRPFVVAQVPKSVDEAPKSTVELKGEFRLIYAGNIGRFQNLDIILDLAKKLIDYPKISITFLGDGVLTDRLKERVKDEDLTNVTFIGHQPIEIAREAISRAHLGLVTLQNDVYKYAYPSKTMTYLCLDKPVVYIAEGNSNLARSIAENGWGIADENDSLNSLSSRILELSRLPAEYDKLVISARKFAQSEFREEAVLPKWTKLYSEASGL